MPSGSDHACHNSMTSFRKRKLSDYVVETKRARCQAVMDARPALSSLSIAAIVNALHDGDGAAVASPRSDGAVPHQWPHANPLICQKNHHCYEAAPEKNTG
jgi:hypothetical protein